MRTALQTLYLVDISKLGTRRRRAPDGIAERGIHIEKLNCGILSVNEDPII
jgi:hypothetical protein